MQGLQGANTQIHSQLYVYGKRLRSGGFIEGILVVKGYLWSMGVARGAEMHSCSRGDRPKIPVQMLFSQGFDEGIGNGFQTFRVCHHPGMSTNPNLNIFTDR